MKRQGMNVTIEQLRNLIHDLEHQLHTLNIELEITKTEEDHKFLISIINKTPECSDTWEIEK